MVASKPGKSTLPDFRLHGLLKMDTLMNWKSVIDIFCVTGFCFRQSASSFHGLTTYCRSNKFADRGYLMKKMGTEYIKLVSEYLKNAKLGQLGRKKPELGFAMSFWRN